MFQHTSCKRAMEEKVRDFVYLDTKRYVSIESLRLFYWAIFIIPFMMVVMGIVGKSAFPLVSIAVWSVLYSTFVLVLQSKRVKKTFELRFLVNGITGLFTSSLFWILYTSIHVVSDNPFLEFDFFLWVLLFYLLFTVVYIAGIILGVHKGIYGKIKEKSQTKTALAITAFFASVLPGAGVSGIHTGKLLRAHASVSVQNTVVTIGFVLLIFLPALAHINFVQYYYCRRYGITCDEDGDTTSPKLECKPSKSKTRKKGKKSCKKNDKKKIPLVLKILIGIACVPVAIFLILLLIGFILNL